MPTQSVEFESWSEAVLKLLSHWGDQEDQQIQKGTLVSQGG